jgi:hypothetical protein
MAGLCLPAQGVGRKFVLALITRRQEQSGSG